jgi:hypothetical protein
MVIDWIHQIQYTGTALIMSMDEDGAEKKKTWRVAPCDAISHINIIIECLLDLFWLPVTAMTVHLRVYRCRTVWSVSPWIGGLKIDPCAEVGPFFFFSFFFFNIPIYFNEPRLRIFVKSMTRQIILSLRSPQVDKSSFFQARADGFINIIALPFIVHLLQNTLSQVANQSYKPADQWIRYHMSTPKSPSTRCSTFILRSKGDTYQTYKMIRK